MNRPGDVIDNPVTGEKMVFLQTGAETNGELLQIDLFVKPGGFVAAEHVHPFQDERFVIKSGTITLRIAGQEQQLATGQEAKVPAGTPHVWWNSNNEELHVVLEFRPAGRFDGFITSAFALAKAGKTNGQGLPNPLQLAVLLQEYHDVIRLTNPPPLSGVLAPIGKWLGYTADYPYSR